MPNATVRLKYRRSIEDHEKNDGIELSSTDPEIHKHLAQQSQMLVLLQPYFDLESIILKFLPQLSLTSKYG